MKTIKILAALVLTFGVASVNAQEKTKGEVQPVKKEVKVVEKERVKTETVQPTKAKTVEPVRKETVQPIKTQSTPVKRAEEKAVEPREKVEAPKK